ncbi:MAG: GNAT family N-acetyltransferase [Candidatus Hydrogenedentes bacterium]|nr:GNAT family N-acetyltransferase [Candidatus Hydrogenedentota bacterium]MBI3117960.1 GNAT family N-acetyltransferase [Candidatus Hydrogenedentota bacterium]
MPITTDMFLRRAERDDLDIIVGWMEQPDFQHFLYGDPARSQKQIREQIVSMLGRSGGVSMPGGVYLLIDSKKDGPVGLLSLQNISWRNRSCMLDLYIGNTQLRARMATAIAVYRALEYCFDELNLHRVSAFIYAFNTASWRIFEKAGAVRECVLKDHLPRDGKLYDVYGYGLLRREFEAVRERHRRSTEGFSLSAMMESLGAEEAGGAP